MSQDKEVLYAVSEITDFKQEYSGAVSSYKVGINELTLINTVSSHGASPTHIHIADETLFLSDYCSGVLTSVEILADGSLGNARQVIDHNTKPVIDCDGAHAHEVVTEGENAYVVDLGLNSIYHYNYNVSSGNVQEADIVKFAAGAGPRHILLHPTLNFAFVISELDSTITTLLYDRATGVLIPTAVVSSLRPGESSVGMGAAELQISRDGKFLYASNRDVSTPNQGRSSIGVFAINPSDGELKLVQHVATLGVHPRHFTIDHDSNTLIVANMESNNLVTFKLSAVEGTIDEASGVAYVADTLLAPSHVLIVD